MSLQQIRSKFQVPNAKDAHDAESVAEEWYDIINAGEYQRNGVQMNASLNAATVLGYQPLFAVSTTTVMSGPTAAAINYIPAPGMSTKAAYYAYPVTQLSVTPDTYAGGYNLSLPRPFNNAGSDLYLGVSGVSGGGYVAPTTADYRFTAAMQGTFGTGTVNAGSAILLFLVVQRNGTLVSQVICPSSVVELANATSTGYANRISLAAELKLNQGDAVTLFVGLAYCQSNMTIQKIVFTGSKLTLN